MSDELECIIWCPLCQVPKATVYRVPAENEGVYMNRTDPPDFADRMCMCGAVLERKS